MNAEKTEIFIILKKNKYSESDLILHALSSDGSKKSFIAKGALKSKKRFGGGVLEPTHYVKFTYKPTHSEDGLNYLNEASLIDDFRSIRLDYDKIEFALNMMNCAYHVSQEGEIESHFLFNLLGHGLRYLNSCESQYLSHFKLHFYLKFLFQQGVISIENWMSLYLKTNLSDSDKIAQMDKQDEIVKNYLDSIELQVLSYIKTAQTY